MIREINIKAGLALHIIDTPVENDLTVHYDHCTSPVVFGFYLSGQGENSVNTATGKTISYRGKQGDCGISCFRKISGVCQYPSQQRLQVLHVLVETFLLDELMSGYQEKIPAKFLSVLNQKGDNYYNKTTLSCAVQSAVGQLLYCPFQGATQRIYRESKVLELIALQLDTLVFNYSNGGAERSPHRAEIEQIYAAREIMQNRYLDPPSLGELSREVGLNEFKLKKGFQSVFGNTAFGCLYDHRMEHARQHLEEGGKSVKEIAYAVGYQSTSRFSDAFKRKFGVRPTHYRP